MKILNKLSFVGLALCIGLCVYLSGVFGYAKDFCETTIAPSTTQSTMKSQQAVFACKPGALDRTQRERYSVLTKQLIADKKEVKELSDGYSLTYAASEQNIKDVAEFTAYERLCCPFINFEIAIEGDNLSLSLKGQEGIKDFIKSEFGV